MKIICLMEFKMTETWISIICSENPFNVITTRIFMHCFDEVWSLINLINCCERLGILGLFEFQKHLIYNSAFVSLVTSANNKRRIYVFYKVLHFRCNYVNVNDQTGLHVACLQCYAKVIKILFLRFHYLLHSTSKNCT